MCGSASERTWAMSWGETVIGWLSKRSGCVIDVYCPSRRLGRHPLPAQVGFIRLGPLIRVTQLGQARVGLGEGWGEGVRSLERSRTPSPQPSPLRGEGVHRACRKFSDKLM